MCTLSKRSKNTSENRSPLSGRTKAGFSQTNPERSVVLTSGEEAPKEGGLLPGEEVRPTDPGKKRSQESGVRRRQDDAGTGRDGDAAKKTEDEGNEKLKGEIVEAVKAVETVEIVKSAKGIKWSNRRVVKSLKA